MLHLQSFVNVTSFAKPIEETKKNDFWIGKLDLDGNGSSHLERSTNASIDEMAFWNRGISENEIGALYEYSKHGFS